MTLILSGTDGLSDVDGSAATPAIRGTDANTGIFFGADIIGFAEGGAEVARFNADAQFVAAAGTASLPVITTTGDVNTGIFFPAADTIAFTEGGVESMRIDSSGNLGLGVTPSAWANYSAFQIGAQSSLVGNASFAILSQNWRFDGSDKYIATAAASQYYQGSGAHVWRTAASGTAGNTISFTQAMTLDSSGRLLVGTTDTTGVAGNGVKIKSNAIGSTSSVALTLEGTGGDFYALKCANVDMSLGSISSGGSPYWTFGSSTQTALLLFPTGVVRMPVVYGNTVTTPRNVFIDSSGTLGGISSVRASKSNITPITDSAWLYQVSPVTFNYRKRDEDGNYLDEVESETQYGLIAEDVEEVRPEFCIYVEKDGQQVLQGVHYDRMISPLIKAIQEQQALITTLTDRITALENK
jgi:hypothetical protein